MRHRARSRWYLNTSTEYNKSCTSETDERGMGTTQTKRHLKKSTVSVSIGKHSGKRTKGWRLNSQVCTTRIFEPSGMFLPRLAYK